MPQCGCSSINELRESGFKLSNKAFNEDAIYSRFYSCSQAVSDASDEDELKSTIETIFKKATDQFPEVEKVLAKVFAKA